MVTQEAGHASGRWQIDVSGIQNIDTRHCTVDTSVAETWQTAEFPSSSMGLSLVPEAQETDTTRIVECLRTALPDSEVTAKKVAMTDVPLQEPPVIGAEPADPDPSAPLVTPAQEAIPQCEPTDSDAQIQELEGSTSATSCIIGEALPLTQEEMMNVIPVPTPVFPTLASDADAK